MRPLPQQVVVGLAFVACLAAVRPAVAEEEGLADSLVAAAEASERAVAAGGTPALPPVFRFDERPAWSGRIDAALAADSNPQLLSPDLRLPDGHGKVVDGSDHDALGSLGAQVDVVPLADRHGWTLGAGLAGDRSFHRDFTYLDLTEVRGTVELARGADPRGWIDGPLGPAQVPFGSDRTSCLLQAGSSQWWLGGESYLLTLEGGAALALRESPAAATGLDLAYVDRRFSGFYTGRSGQDATLGLSQLLFFGRTDRFLRLQAAGTDRSAGRRFSSRRAEGGGELALPLGLRWLLRLSGSYARESFDHPESNLFHPAGPAREDRTSRGAAALSFAATARLRLTARAAFTHRSSNVDLGAGLDLDYRRSEIALAAGWVF